MRLAIVVQETRATIVIVSPVETAVTTKAEAVGAFRAFVALHAGEIHICQELVARPEWSTTFHYVVEGHHLPKIQSSTAVPVQEIKEGRIIHSFMAFLFHEFHELRNVHVVVAILSIASKHWCAKFLVLSDPAL